MTALEITKALKANKNSVLWISEDGKSAAFMGGNETACLSVSAKAAVVAKDDPAFGVVSQTDGAVFAAI